MPNQDETQSHCYEKFELVELPPLAIELIKHALVESDSLLDGDERAYRVGVAVFRAIYKHVLRDGEGLMGVKEVGAELGVTTQRAEQLHQAATLPSPFARVGGRRRLWLAQDIEEYHNDRVGTASTLIDPVSDDSDAAPQTLEGRPQVNRPV